MMSSILRPRWSNVWRCIVLAFLLLVPFLNYMRYLPLQDWWTHAMVLVGIALAAVTGAVRRQYYPFLNKASLFLFAFAVYVLMSGSLVGGNPMGTRVATVVLLGMVIVSQYFMAENLRSRRTLVTCVAYVLLAGSCIQSVLGLTQVLGIAPHLHGFVLFHLQQNAPEGIIGNIGQRNHYTHYLSWGMLAACYLYAQNKLKMLVLLPCLFLMGLLMSWSGARLPLAYGLALSLLALIWYKRRKEDQEVRRMALAVAIAVICIAYTQLFIGQINAILDDMGASIHLGSGSDRLLDAGFGIRRRIEWAKAWYLFTQHPVLGLGWDGYAAAGSQLELDGGWPKAPESVLFTHAHNLLFQLLAETGVVGTALVVIALLVCLVPYFYRKQGSADNLMLIGMAAITLGHSMVEFPLWYMPFLVGLVLVMALSPLQLVSFPVRKQFGQVVLLGSSVITWICVGLGSYYFSILIDSYPGQDVAKNELRISQLFKLCADPFWEEDMWQALARYIVLDRSALQFKLNVYHSLARYRPYPVILVNLAILQALNHQNTQAKRTVQLFIANYPDMVPNLVQQLSNYKQSNLIPLLIIARKAERAYLSTESLNTRRLAVVATVAAPVTKRLLF